MSHTQAWFSHTFNHLRTLPLCLGNRKNCFRVNYFSLWQEQSSEMEKLKIQIMVLTFGICVTLGQLLNLFEPQFPHL